MPSRQVTRLRTLSPGQQHRLQALRGISRLLDSAFIVPGTSYRIGLDPIVGLLPGLGDLVSPLFTLGIIWQARDLGLPRVVQMRMIFNVAIDTLLGMVPVAGDLFDFAWKANDMNMALLDRYAHEQRRPTPSDWAFVGAISLLLLAIAAAPFIVAGWVFSLAASVFSS